MHNLANVFKDQGKYETAKQLYEKCLIVQREVLGMNHPDTQKSQINLQLVLRDLAKSNISVMLEGNASK
jgi:hypothetical protein